MSQFNQGLQSHPRPVTADPRPATVLILGAGGRLGGAATRAFAAAGWRVLAHSRRPISFPAGVTALSHAMEDVNTLAQMVRAQGGASVLLHAVNPAYGDWARQALPAARAGMALAEELQASFVLPGNVYNFGSGMPPLLLPSCAHLPDTRKGKIREDIETLMRQRSAHGLRSLVLRAGDFFGAGRGSWLDLVITAKLRQGRLVFPGALDLPHAWAYLPDLAAAFVALAERERRRPNHHGAAFENLHFAGHTLRGDELLNAIETAAASLRPAAGWRRIGMPWGAMRCLAWAVPAWRGVLEMRYLWQRPHALDGRALAQAVGPLPSTPLPQAVASSLSELGFLPAPRQAATVALEQA